MDAANPLDDADLPSVTVVVPAYNEEAHIGRCLSSLRALDYPSHLVELVVVDNGSRDRTASIVRELGVRLLSLPQGFVGAVRNHGVARSSGKYVAFLDADCVAPERWLRTALELLLRRPQLGAVGGRYRADASATWIERAWESGGAGHEATVGSLAAGSMVMSRSLFVELGGFNERLTAGEDCDLSARIRARGRSLLSHPDCAVVHLGWPRNLTGVFRRQLWHGSSQLESAHGFWNLTNLSTHLFLLAPFLALAWGLATGFGVAGALLPLAIDFALPALAGLSHSRGLVPWQERIRRVLLLYPLFWFYYLGRSAGLLRNYRNLLARRLRR